MPLSILDEQIRACRLCVDASVGRPLAHQPNPVFVLSQSARICISGQAPGVRVHHSGKPFTDPSGDRLRSWMGVGEATFYDASKIAIVPMGFCFPGHDAKGGDLPPRKECRSQWHDEVYAAMPQLELILAVGKYAQDYHLSGRQGKNMTETVRAWRGYAAPTKPVILPMPHPSWRNNTWLKRNDWFENELLPVLRAQIQILL